MWRSTRLGTSGSRLSFTSNFCARFALFYRLSFANKDQRLLLFGSLERVVRGVKLTSGLKYTRCPYTRRMGLAPVRGNPAEARITVIKLSNGVIKKVFCTIYFSKKCLIKKMSDEEQQKSLFESHPETWVKHSKGRDHGTRRTPKTWEAEEDPSSESTWVRLCTWIALLLAEVLSRLSCTRN